MNAFFKTHECNPLCHKLEQLELSTHKAAFGAALSVKPAVAKARKGREKSPPKAHSDPNAAVDVVGAALKDLKI